MKQLKRKHSEIRLSSFQLLIEIFERSHNFRIMVLEELQFILNQTLETNNRKEIKTGSQISEDRNSGRKSATPQRQTR